MRIGVDVMGGDNAPGAILDGALASLETLDPSDELVLFGDKSIIQAGVDSLKSARTKQVAIVATTQVVGLDEPPVEAVRAKPDSSITVLCKHAGRKAGNPVDVVISAGSTGAQVTAAQMYMRRLPNVHRPGIAVAVPTFAGPIVLIDVGANIEPKPHHLAQYGVMGDVYARMVLGIADPRIALMNVGGEEQKGTADMKEARDRLRSVSDLNFIGYVEGRGVFDGEADVIITDGVVGNVMLKLAEGLSSGIFKMIAREVFRIDPKLAGQLEPVVKSLSARYDYHEYGGAPLLGVRRIVVIGHGSSNARAIRNAIRSVKEFSERGASERIERAVAATNARENRSLRAVAER
jgi:glycerol-3-phosphate acyltransferase PlsX